MFNIERRKIHVDGYYGYWRYCSISGIIDCFGSLLFGSLFSIGRVISPRTVKDEDVELFHSPGYVECLRNLSQEDDVEKYDEEAEMYGLSKSTKVS